jgi:hypothetical protein
MKRTTGPANATRNSLYHTLASSLETSLMATEIGPASVHHLPTSEKNYTFFMAGSPDSDIDARFRELIHDEYGTDVPTAAIPEPAPPKTPYRAGRDDFFSMDQALADADPTPDDIDAFHAPDPPLDLPRRPRFWIGAALLSLGIVIGLFGAFGLRADPVVLGIGGAGFVIGLVLLLLSIPKHRYSDDDGVRL